MNKTASKINIEFELSAIWVRFGEFHANAAGPRLHDGRAEKLANVSIGWVAQYNFDICGSRQHPSRLDILNPHSGQAQRFQHVIDASIGFLMVTDQ